MMEDEKREHVLKMKKMEAEMEQVFDQKVEQKRLKLKESENDVCVFSVCILKCFEMIFMLIKPHCEGNVIKVAFLLLLLLMAIRLAIMVMTNI